MGNFRSNNRGGDRRGFGGRDSGRPAMHDAICDECGKNCKVPFRPSGDKPIYCSDCFEKKGGRSADTRPQRDSRGPSRGGSDNVDIRKLTQNIETLNSKLDVIISLLNVEKNKSQSELKVSSKPKAKPKKAKKSPKKK